jgi:hypothetical protein
MVDSRAFMVKINGQFEMVLCPIADMLNHMCTVVNKQTELEPQTRYGYDDMTQCFFLEAM